MLKHEGPLFTVLGTIFFTRHAFICVLGGAFTIVYNAKTQLDSHSRILKQCYNPKPNGCMKMILRTIQ
jgi:hypothetical protein